MFCAGPILDLFFPRNGLLGSSTNFGTDEQITLVAAREFYGLAQALAMLALPALQIAGYADVKHGVSRVGESANVENHSERTKRNVTPSVAAA